MSIVKYNKIKKEELEKANNKLNLKEMAKYFGVSIDTIRNALKYYNIEHKEIREKEKIKIDKKELLEKAKEMSLNELCEYFGCKRSTMQKRLKQNGIKLRNYITQDEIDKIKSIAKGHTKREIIKITGIKENRVSLILANHPEIHYVQIRHDKKDIDIKKLKELLKTDKSVQKICKELGISESLYSKILKKNKLTRDNEIKKKAQKKQVVETSKKRYGAKYYTQSKDWKKRLPESIEKFKQTNLEKYGYEYPVFNEKVNKKRQQTNLKRYGTKETYSSKQIREKIKQTNIKKYGYEVATQNENIRNKVVRTNLEKYGVEFPLSSDKIRSKTQNTMEQKYGVKSYSQTKEWKDKSKQTNLKKYGVEWTCQRPEARLKGNDSEPNRIFAELLKEYKIKYDREFNLKKYSYDFKVGDMLIEIDPSITHNSTFGIYKRKPLEKTYHKDKSQFATENGYHCIHIWDWDDTEKIVKLFLVEKQKVYARQCEIREIDKKEADKFLEEWHLQGKCRGNEINIGLYSKDELVMIMTFGSPRYNKNYEYELLRLCSSKVVVGGTDKIWKYFIENYKPKSVISYCDSSKFSGEVYEKLGFKLKNKKIQPSKHWYHLKKRVHITDNLLKQRGFDQLLGKEYGCYGKGTSNTELMVEHGFVEVYDAGQQVWIWEEKK